MTNSHQLSEANREDSGRKWQSQRNLQKNVYTHSATIVAGILGDAEF